MITFVDAVGIIGVVLVLLTYFLLQTEKISSRSLTYSFSNAIGSLCIMISLFKSWNLPSVIIELAWFVISIYGIYRFLRKKF